MAPGGDELISTGSFILCNVGFYKLYLNSYQYPRLFAGQLDAIGMEGVVLFRRHDRNRDGVLNLKEFEPLAHRLIQAQVGFFSRFRVGVTEALSINFPVMILQKYLLGSLNHLYI